MRELKDISAEMLKNNKIPVEDVEKDLVFLGATGVEDIL
jgi:magnesium-transporting ATPase (P-type)